MWEHFFSPAMPKIPEFLCSVFLSWFQSVHVTYRCWKLLKLRSFVVYPNMTLLSSQLGVNSFVFVRRWYFVVFKLGGNLSCSWPLSPHPSTLVLCGHWSLTVIGRGGRTYAVHLEIPITITWIQWCSFCVKWIKRCDYAKKKASVQFIILELQFGFIIFDSIGVSEFNNGSTTDKWQRSISEMNDDKTLIKLRHTLVFLTINTIYI
jgi:hypothetical protein